MATDPTGIGFDFSFYPEISPTLALVSGPRALIERIYRRLTTGRGSLTFHPGDGKDVRSYLSEGFTPAKIFAVKADLEQEILKDEAVDQVQVSPVFNFQTGVLKISASASAATGPFKFTLLVTQLDVTLLTEA